MKLNFITIGIGSPLLLIHGLGGSLKSWDNIIEALALSRRVIAIDLPGFGQTPPHAGEVTISKLADAVTSFIEDNDLRGIDAVGTSMGARLVLELARRQNIIGKVVSLNPGGFWKGWETHLFYISIAVSIRLIRLIKPVLKPIIFSQLGRSLLLFQFSAIPRKVLGHIALGELKDYLNSISFDNLLYNLAYGEEQKGTAANTLQHPMVIVWGKKDRVCFPAQAKRALVKFPDAELIWLEECGHFPHWDRPEETVKIILEHTN